jgi:hypothetical protein
LVLEEGVIMEDITNDKDKTLMRWFMGKKLVEDSMRLWMEKASLGR